MNNRCLVPPAIVRRPLSESLPSQLISYYQLSALTQRKLDSLLDQLNRLDDVNFIPQLATVAKKIKCICNKQEDVNYVADFIYQYALKSRANAHIGAIMCSYLSDFIIKQAEFETIMLYRIYRDYEERHTIRKQKALFLTNVAFLCEVFHHLKLLKKVPLKPLIPALDNYFSMLLDSGTEDEITVLFEYLPKCHQDIKNSYPKQFENLLLKMKKLILWNHTQEATRSLLLYTFELVISERSLSEKVKLLYKLYCKPIVSICK